MRNRHVRSNRSNSGAWDVVVEVKVDEGLAIIISYSLILSIYIFSKNGLEELGGVCFAFCF